MYIYLDVWQQMTDIELLLVCSSAWDWVYANKWLKVNRTICIRWRYVKSFNCRKISSGLFKNVICKLITNHMYNHLTMCKNIADVGMNCSCKLAVLGAIWLCAGRWALADLECYLFSIHLEILGLICVLARFGIE